MIETNMIKDESFGIIPILRQGDTCSFLLIQHQAGHWGFPKGHANSGESAVQAGCRELVEETGISEYTLVEEVSFSERYTFTKKDNIFDKTVTYFLAFVQSMTVKVQPEEIQDYTWVDYETALSLITYDPSKQVLKEVNSYLITAFLRVN